MLWHKNQRMGDEIIIVELLIELKNEIKSQHTISIHQMLKATFLEHGISIGWNRLHEIRRKHNLLTKRKRRYVQTTDSNHRFRKYKNKIKELEALAPEQLWVSDITYLKIKNKFVSYL